MISASSPYFKINLNQGKRKHEINNRTRVMD
jgi:hypothetical protein